MINYHVDISAYIFWWMHIVNMIYNFFIYFRVSFLFCCWPTLYSLFKCRCCSLLSYFFSSFLRFHLRLRSRPSSQLKTVCRSSIRRLLVHWVVRVVRSNVLKPEPITNVSYLQICLWWFMNNSILRLPSVEHEECVWWTMRDVEEHIWDAVMGRDDGASKIFCGKNIIPK